MVHTDELVLNAGPQESAAYRVYAWSGDGGPSLACCHGQTEDLLEAWARYEEAKHGYEHAVLYQCEPGPILTRYGTVLATTGWKGHPNALHRY